MMNARRLLWVLSVLAVLVLSACTGQRVVPQYAVTDIPPSGYQSILRLNNPDGAPDRTLAGIVHVTGRASVCVDFPRQERLKSLADLPEIDQAEFHYFQHYAIRDKEKIFGYVSVPIGYRTFVWHKDDDPACRYWVQVVPPNEAWRRVDRLDSDKSPASW